MYGKGLVEEWNIRFRRPPLPEVIGPLNIPAILTGCNEWRRGFTSFRGRARSVIEGHFQQHELNCNHDEGLDQEGGIELRAWIVEHSAPTTSISCSFLSQIAITVVEFADME